MSHWVQGLQSGMRRAVPCPNFPDPANHVLGPTRSISVSCPTKNYMYPRGGPSHAQIFPTPETMSLEYPDRFPSHAQKILDVPQGGGPVPCPKFFDPWKMVPGCPRSISVSCPKVFTGTPGGPSHDKVKHGDVVGVHIPTENDNPPQDCFFFFK